MIATLDKFLSNTIDYSSMVRNLEGLMDTAGISDENLTKKWYDIWGPLEILNATKSGAVKPEDVREEIEAMRQFLLHSVEQT